MDTAIEPAKTTGTDGAQASAEEWRDREPDEFHGGRDLLKSVLPILVGSVAVGVAAVTVIGVGLRRRRKSKTLLGRATAQAEDAMDALVHAAAGLPERGKAAMKRVRR